MFADLSNFSQLVATLDTEDLVVLVDPVLDSLAGIVERQGGTVEKFAGDALLALFGAPVAHEDDPARAAQAAADMHDYLARADIGSLTEPLRLHIGIATGPVIARMIGAPTRADYAVLGDAVVLAQRLQSAAGPGDTYLDAPTADLVGAGFLVESVGELSLKGRTRPTAAFRLGGAGRSQPTTLRPLVGRDRELSTLAAALAEAAAGRSVLLSITGPAGYGKSQLLAHLKRDAESNGITAVELVASSFTQQPYGAVRPVVDRALERRWPETSTRTERLARLAEDDAAPASAALTAVLLGSDAGQPTLAERTPAALRRELQAGALAWWRDLAGRGPLLVTLDNAQWLDAPSAEVVRSIADSAEQAATLICVASRRVDGLPVAAGEKIELAPLSREAVAELVAGELGLEPAAKLVTVLAERGAGNPMAVRESTRQLAAEGLLDVHHGHARLVSGASPSSAPAPLGALLAARIDALPPATVNLATLAAVLGPATPITMLRTASGVSAAELASGVADLVDAGFATVAHEVLRFDTPLLREVLYDRLTARRRRELHARVAAVAANDPATPLAALAEHLYRSGDAARALPALRRLAAQHRRLFEHDSAARTLARAVETAREAAPRLVPVLLCDLGDVRVECGEYGAAAAVYAEAAELGNDARAWAGRGGALRRSGDYTGSLVLLDEAWKSRPTGDLRLIWCELAWTHSVAGHLEQSRAAADRGLSLGSADDEVRAGLLLQRVRVATLLGELDTATGDATRAVAMLERESDTAGLCTALRLLGDLQHQRGDLDQAVDTLERGLATAERAGLVEEQGGCLINLGLIHGDRGDHAAASEAYARAAVVFEQAGHTAGCATAYGNRAYEFFMLGDLEGGRDLGRRALELAESMGHHLSIADVQHTLGLIAERSGDLPAARRHAAAAIGEFEAAGLPQAGVASRELAERVMAAVS